MKFQFTNKACDFIDFNLYEASKSERINKKRKKAIFQVPISLAVLACLLLIIQDYLMSQIFSAVGVLWYLFYPRIQSNYYKKHYTNFIKDKFSKTDLYETLLTIDEVFIFMQSKAGETKQNITELKKVVEIESIIIFYLHIGNAILIPKKEIKEIEKYRVEFTSLARAHNFIYEKELNWKWK